LTPPEGRITECLPPEWYLRIKECWYPLTHLDVKISTRSAAAESRLWYTEPWANSPALALPWCVIHQADGVPHFFLNPPFDVVIFKVCFQDSRVSLRWIRRSVCVEQSAFCSRRGDINILHLAVSIPGMKILSATL
jgi:hypothetical protein